MESRQSLTARLASWDKSIDEADVLLPIPFHLSEEITTETSPPVDGIAALLKDRFVI